MKRNAGPVEQHYTVVELAQLLAVDERTVWRLIRSGKISRCVRLSRKCTRVPASAVNALLQRGAGAVA
jgi:excisionase family DNA binding protein